LAADIPLSLGRGMTVPELARRYRVGQHTVRTWIRSGLIAAVNTASPLARPRWVVTAESLAAFEARRRAETPAQHVPRRRRQTQLIDYYPD